MPDGTEAGAPRERGQQQHRVHQHPARMNRRAEAKRGRMLGVRLSDDEYAAIAAAAAADGLTPTGFAAQAALARARVNVTPDNRPLVDAKVELMLAREQLRRYATNVNQAVAKLHATGEPPPWLAAAVEGSNRAVEHVDQVAVELMAMLRRRG